VIPADGALNYFAYPMQELFRAAKSDEPIRLPDCETITSNTITSNNIASAHFELNFNTKSFEPRVPDKYPAVFKAVIACLSKLKELCTCAADIQVNLD